MTSVKQIKLGLHSVILDIDDQKIIIKEIGMGDITFKDLELYIEKEKIIELLEDIVKGFKKVSDK
jgi:hypothetical protein